MASEYLNSVNKRSEEIGPPTCDVTSIHILTPDGRLSIKNLYILDRGENSYGVEEEVDSAGPSTPSEDGAGRGRRG